jgi:hypothetical protein
MSDLSIICSQDRIRTCKPECQLFSHELRKVLFILASTYELAFASTVGWVTPDTALPPPDYFNLHLMLNIFYIMGTFCKLCLTLIIM